MQKKKYLVFILATLLLLIAIMGILSVSAFGTGGKTDGEGVSVQTEIGTSVVSRNSGSDSGYDFVFVIDNSRSIWKQQAERDQALRTVANLSVGSDVRIGSVYFADHVYKTFSLTSVENQEDYNKVINDGLTLTKQDSQNLDTNIGAGLEAGLKLLEDQDSGRKQIMILVSDGINENLAQSASYKESADKKTAEQAKKLKAQGVELYCVFIEKDRADEDYLKNLVNTVAGDSKAADEKFVAVSDNQIERLADTFSQIFYSMKGNMKYKQISLDSSGRYTFHIPDLSVQKLQIYLNNSNSMDVNLTRADGEEFEKNAWSDGNSIFFTVDDPESGDWVLEVSGDNAQDATGTVAYYTDLYASGSFDDNEEIYKGCTTKVDVGFMNADGDSIDLDNAAVVTANVKIKDDNGKTVQQFKNLPMTVEGCQAYTDEIELNETGSVYVTVRVKYDEFIDLSYKIIDGMEVQNFAPETSGSATKLSSITVETDSGTKEQFTLDLENYIEDKDSDVQNFTVQSVDVINEENPPSEVSIKQGKLICLVDKADDVEFVVTLADDTGLTTQLTVDGLVVNKTKERSRNAMIIFVIAVIIILIGIYAGLIYAKKREYRANLDVLKGLLEKLLADRKKLDALMTSKKEKVEAQAETLQSSVAVLEDRSYIETFEKVKTFILEHKIADEVLQVLGVLEDVQRPTMQTVSLTANELYKRYDRQETVLTEVIAGYQRQNGKIPRKMMEEQIDKLRKDIAKYENEIRENPDPVEQIEGISESLMRTTQSLKDLHSCLEQACQQKFSCNLSIEMSENSCFKAKNQEWYWKLDDVTVTSKNCKVEKFLNQKTQIVFFPYNGINATTGLPETGVLIAAPYVLNFRESTDIKMRSDTQTVLLKNKSYIIDASIVVGSMIIKVL